MAQIKQNPNKVKLRITFLKDAQVKNYDQVVAAYDYHNEAIQLTSRLLELNVREQLVILAHEIGHYVSITLFDCLFDPKGKDYRDEYLANWIALNILRLFDAQHKTSLAPKAVAMFDEHYAVCTEAGYKHMDPQSCLSLTDKAREYVGPHLKSYADILNNTFNTFNKYVEKYGYVIFTDKIKLGDNKMLLYRGSDTSFEEELEEKPELYFSESREFAENYGNVTAFYVDEEQVEMELDHLSAEPSYIIQVEELVQKLGTAIQVEE